jgi:hypothetical protein
MVFCFSFAAPGTGWAASAKLGAKEGEGEGKGFERGFVIVLLWKGMMMKGEEDEDKEGRRRNVGYFCFLFAKRTCASIWSCCSSSTSLQTL